LTPPPVALAHTADLSPDRLAAARTLIYRCFDEVTESDWEHALGGRALGATDVGARLYAARGWQRWRGPTSALTPAGVVRTAEEDGCVFVFGARGELDFTGELTCDHRDGDAW